MNLIQNAIQAMDGHGKITVSTSVRRSPRARMPSYDGAPPPSRRSMVEDTELVEVGVRDTGPGISPKVLRNLFIPFFTTKTQGTGLGLAISQSIVQKRGRHDRSAIAARRGHDVHHRPAFGGRLARDARPHGERPDLEPPLDLTVTILFFLAALWLGGSLLLAPVHP